MTRSRKKVRKYSKMPRNYLSRFVASVLLSFTAVASTTTSEPGVMYFRAALGRNAHLPCGPRRVLLDGPDAFVLWFQGDRLLYRFPDEETENRSTSAARVYGTTCVEGFCYDATYLLLKRVSFGHDGRYRCRIQYQSSPASDFYVELRLVEAPGEPRLYDENGVQIKKTQVGPVALGDPIFMLCEVHDDQPQTIVYWKRNGVKLKRADWVSPGVLRTKIHIENATRDELDAHYECLVQNADISDPLVVGVVIKMNLPPLSVEIRMNWDQDFEAGQPRVVDCIVIGCVPPPTVTWHLGDKELRSNVHKELHDGNYTVSSLTLSPSIHDSGQELVCRAHNANMEGQVFEDKTKIKVGFRPYCATSREQWLGVVTNEAEAVFCLVEAAPAPVQFSWTFADSRTLFTAVRNVSGHKTRYSSGLTWLPRDTDIGPLQCRATNSIGEQTIACVYNVVSGGPPKTPRCFMQSDHPLKVLCREDWNGGRPQIIHLELYSGEGELLHNVSKTNGCFKFSESVDVGSNLSAVVYASSMRGRSETRTIPLQVFRPFILTSNTKEQVGPNPVRQTDGPKLEWLKPLGWCAAILIIMNLLYLLIRLVCADRGPQPGLDLDHVANSSDGSFHREPDVTREDRLLGSANITLTQLGTCQTVTPACVLLNNVTRACSQQCGSSQAPSRRVLLGSGQSDASESVNTLSYYV